MKKKILFTVAILAMALAFFGCPQEDEEIPPPPEYNPDTILSTMWPFPVGVAVPGAKSVSNALNSSNPQHALLKHFNVVVAENEMKPDSILPGSAITLDENTEIDALTWTHSDALVNYAKNNDKRVRGHTLIWHAQTPQWFFAGSGTNRTGSQKGPAQRATIEELYKRMEHYIRLVFKKYGDDIEWWDVCNEVVSQTTSGPRTLAEDSVYTQIMMDSGKTGMDRYEYVLKAFQWARKYADEYGTEGKVKLYLTDFGIERPFDRNNVAKQKDFEDLVDWLIENDAPIDGVGFQSHFRLFDHPASQISEGIDLFAEKEKKDGTKLMVQICELDIQLFNNTTGNMRAVTIPAENLASMLDSQANSYREFFDMFEQKFNENKIDMVVIWGIADGQSWLNFRTDDPEVYPSGRIDHPLLFNRNYKGKEAYNKLVSNRDEFPNPFDED